MSSKSVEQNESSSSHLLVSMDPICSIVNTNMRSRGLERSMMVWSIYSRSHHNSQHSCSILRQESRSLTSVQHQDPRRHNLLWWWAIREVSMPSNKIRSATINSSIIVSSNERLSSNESRWMRDTISEILDEPSQSSMILEIVCSIIFSLMLHVLQRDVSHSTMRRPMDSGHCPISWTNQSSSPSFSKSLLLISNNEVHSSIRRVPSLQKRTNEWSQNSSSLMTMRLSRISISDSQTAHGGLMDSHHSVKILTIQRYLQRLYVSSRVMRQRDSSSQKSERYSPTSSRNLQGSRPILLSPTWVWGFCIHSTVARGQLDRRGRRAPYLQLFSVA